MYRKTILPDEQCALVTKDNRENLELILPSGVTAIIRFAHRGHTGFSTTRNSFRRKWIGLKSMPRTVSTSASTPPPPQSAPAERARTANARLVLS